MLNLDTYLAPCTKLKSKWYNDLSIETEIKKLLQDKIGKIIKGISVGKDLLNRTPLAEK